MSCYKEYKLAVQSPNIYCIVVSGWQRAVQYIITNNTTLVKMLYNPSLRHHQVTSLVRATSLPPTSRHLTTDWTLRERRAEFTSSVLQLSSLLINNIQPVSRGLEAWIFLFDVNDKLSPCYLNNSDPRLGL